MSLGRKLDRTVDEGRSHTVDEASSGCDVDVAYDRHISRNVRTAGEPR